MISRLAVDDRRANADARLAFGVAAACSVAYGAFVVLPYYVTDLWLPSGVDVLWALGGMSTLVLGPVAAGLSGYASVVALWLHGDALPDTSRRLHLATLLLVATVFVALVSPWGSDIMTSWLSD